MKERLVVLALLTATLLGCTPATQEEVSMQKPISSTTANTVFTPYEVKAEDGTYLQAYEWKPRQGAVRAAIVVIHGIRDHASRYAALAESLSINGMAVYAQDHRGHGHSGGKRQYFDSIEQLVADVHLAVSEAQKRNPGVPVFLYGHSLGGLVATHYALSYGSTLKGVVLSGPALKLFPSVSGLEKGLAQFFSVILPSLPVQAVDDSEFVRSPAAQAELAADPLIVHANLPARSAAAGLNGIEKAQSRVNEVNVPLLIMHGSSDKATNIEGSRELYAQAKTSDKTLKVWDGLYHDLLHEPEHDEVIQLVVSWIASRL